MAELSDQALMDSAIRKFEEITLDIGYRTFRICAVDWHDFIFSEVNG